MGEKTHREYLSGIDKKLNRIENILIGDKEAEQDGLVHKVKRNSEYIRKDKRFKWAVASVLFGGISSFLAWVKTTLGI